MGKTIFVLTDDNRDPISDSVVVTLTKTTSPFTVFTGTLIPPAGNNNGTRVFVDVTDGDYTVKYDGNTNSDLSPLHVAGPGTVINSTIGNNEVETDMINDNAVTESKIIDGAITADKIATNAVTSTKIASGAITGSSLADGSVQKVKIHTDVFGPVMVDDGGWIPVVDNSTISRDTDVLHVPDSGINTDQIADNAVTEVKIGTGAVTTDKIIDNGITTGKINDGAVTTNKIGLLAVTTDELADDSVTIDKIVNGSVDSDKLADDAVIASKLANDAVTTNNILDGAITIDKFGTSLKNSMIRFPSKVAYVSTEFSDNVAPYFDNIPDAYEYIDDVAGTIYIYPGTYTAPILMGEAVNLIGIDKTRCIIDVTPTASEPYAIKVTASSAQFLIKNLTIKSTANAYLGATIYGIYIDDVGIEMVRIEDCLIYTKAFQSQTTNDPTIGLYLNDVNFRIERCYLLTHSCNYDWTYAGDGAQGIYLIGICSGVIHDCQIGVKAKSGGSEPVHGIYWTNSSQDVDISNCVIEVTDQDSSTGEYTFASGSAVTILVMNTLYSKSNHANVTVTAVQNTQSTNVSIKDSF